MDRRAARDDRVRLRRHRPGAGVLDGRRGAGRAERAAPGGAGGDLLPWPVGGRDREDAGHPARHGEVPHLLRTAGAETRIGGAGDGAVNGCTDVRNALGSYVLGSLDAAERSRAEAHLADCPACRDELAGLAGLPAMLGRVDESQLEQLAGPPPELLDGLLARAAERRRRPWAPGRRFTRWAPLAAAACLLLAIGALFGGFLLPLGTEETAAPPASSAPPAAPPAAPGGDVERIAAANPATDIKGYVLLRKKQWGTEVELHLSGVPKGSHCRMLVIARDGRRDALGSWYVPYDEGYGEYRGSTMFPRGQLFSFEIVGLDGQPLLTIPT
ncbi:zf-HC2 domain-containing protein [Actinomadura sp. GC306]|nr:zf-HC2 domain-containing protein [Actinomadura sp. GC306]